jgi:hypothetical protein
MPKVAGKSYPYTTAGRKKAAAAKKKIKSGSMYMKGTTNIPKKRARKK